MASPTSGSLSNRLDELGTATWIELGGDRMMNTQITCLIFARPRLGIRINPSAGIERG